MTDPSHDPEAMAPTPVTPGYAPVNRPAGTVPTESCEASMPVKPEPEPDTCVTDRFVTARLVTATVLTVSVPRTVAVPMFICAFCGAAEFWTKPDGAGAMGAAKAMKEAYDPTISAAAYAIVFFMAQLPARIPPSPPRAGRSSPHRGGLSPG